MKNRLKKDRGRNAIYSLHCLSAPLASHEGKALPLREQVNDWEGVDNAKGIMALQCILLFLHLDNKHHNELILTDLYSEIAEDQV